MAEIYINKTSPIKTKIFWAGEIKDADGAVKATVYDITDASDVSPPQQVAMFPSATKDETDTGTYYIILPLSLCTNLKKYKVLWEYQVLGSTGAHTDFFEVVQPYANLSDVFEDLNFGTDPSDPNYKSYHDIQMAEKYARKLIEEYTGQNFYPYPDTIVAYGYGSDTLPLPSRLTDLVELYENDVLVYDKNDPLITWLFVPIISESFFGIRVNKNDMADGLVYSANGLVPPTIYDQNYSGAFKRDYRYVIKGTFGWNSIPDNVEEACIVLINDFFNKDKSWRNRYVKRIQTFDWTFEFSEEAFVGTGNAYADQLLNPYVINGMIVV